MKDFAGRVAVITGAAGGIGKAIAEEAAARGMRLLLADIDAARLDATTAALRARGADADGLRTDVARASEVDDLANLAFARFGRVHLLVANAGVACARAAWETTPEDWEWVMGVNLHGVTHALRAFVPRMLSGGEEGHVVATASAAGLLSLPGLAAYNASKHAVVTVMEGLHHDLALRGSRIGASVLCPGWVRTDIASSERSRPAGAPTRAQSVDAFSAKLAGSIQEAVAGGIDPSRVARDLFEAIAAGRFYVLTHADTKKGVKARLEDILGDRVPSLVRL